MRFVILLFSFAIFGCSSLPEKVGLQTPKEEVISRVDNLSSRPEWITESEPFQIKNGVVSSLGMASVPGDSRIEAAYRISANNGKAEVSKAIEQRLSFVLQNAEEGTGFDSSQLRYIGAETSGMTSSSFKLSKQYWEKVFATDEHGYGKTFYRVYSLVQMPEPEFKKAILEASDKRKGKGLSADFKDKVNKHWDQFVNAGHREAASE